VLLGTVFGQYEDYGAYGYSQYSAYEYDQYGNKKNKNQYVAPSYAGSYNNGYGNSYGNSYGKQYGEDEIDKGRFNGLHCWSCDARISADIDVGTGVIDSAFTANNAFVDCVKNGQDQPCRGEERVCLTETRARYDRIYAIHASCKSPDACVAMWRRNARFTLPFMLFGSQTDTTTTPQYMDDECRIYADPTNADQQKFATHRSQWESVCRHCCVATLGHCNLDATTPISYGCNGSGTAVVRAPTAAHGGCSGASLTNAKQTLAAAKYKYEELKVFMKQKLNSLKSDGATLDSALYPMPVEGRNSITESKIHRGKNDWEESDQLSRETLDHFDMRYST